MSELTASDKATRFLENLDGALQRKDSSAAAVLFAHECYWRDLVSFTWNLKTVEGRGQIEDMLKSQLASVKPRNWELNDSEAVTEADGVVEAWFDFETELGRGYGLVRLRDGKAWTFLTTLLELKGFEEPVFGNRPMGAKHGAQKNVTTWKEDRENELETLGYSEQPYTVIIGGGQGGIALAARLRQLNVPTIVIEKNPRAGDSWRNRYKSLCLHDPVWYDHLPYMKFPDNWPVFAPKDKIGDWLEMYTRIMELNYWSSTVCEGASYDDAEGEWTVNVVRDGESVTLRPKQLVLATGMSGKTNVPNFTGQEVFKGEQHHSSQHPGPDGYRGKKVVVVGSNNSAHDICAALWQSDVDVTMIQRSTTHIVRSESLMSIGLGSLYSEEAVQSGMSTEKADLIFASLPYHIMHQFQTPVYDAIKEKDADFYARLEKVGFQLDWGADGSGLFMKYLRRGSGYYIDIGASELIADGSIKLANGQVDHLTETSVVLADGTEVPADVVVYATGFGSMNGWAADLISQEVADKVGKCWGLGSDTPKDPGPWEGEQRNMWKPTQQEALWFHGGNLHQSRHYSKYLSLQLKAKMEGLDAPVYGLQETHHLD